MGDAIFKIPTPLILCKVVTALDGIYEQMAQAREGDMQMLKVGAGVGDSKGARGTGGNGEMNKRRSKGDAHLCQKTADCLLSIPCDAGAVACEGPLRYYVRSRESGSHHDAHIHVCDNAHEYEASVRISDGKVIAGELPADMQKWQRRKFFQIKNTSIPVGTR